MGLGCLADMLKPSEMSKNTGVVKKLYEDFLGLFKGLIGFGQVASSFSLNMNVEWPAALSGFYNRFGGVSCKLRAVHTAFLF